MSVAPLAELVDALDSKSSSRKRVPVRFWRGAPLFCRSRMSFSFFEAKKLAIRFAVQFNLRGKNPSKLRVTGTTRRIQNPVLATECQFDSGGGHHFYAARLYWLNNSLSILPHSCVSSSKTRQNCRLQNGRSFRP